jgi:surface antigen
VLRSYYTRPGVSAARRWIPLLLAAPLLAGCSMMGSPEAPATTGSVSAPVDVQQPLPSTLAYSDAARIGQAASAALWQATGAPQDEWVNARTGSSGTLILQVEQALARADCRPFSTTVTSLGGVHRYSGTLCRGNDARAVLKIAEDTGEADS